MARPTHPRRPPADGSPVVTFEEWIAVGFNSRYCTASDCLTHNLENILANFAEIAPTYVDWDDPPCIPAVIVLPPEVES